MFDYNDIFYKNEDTSKILEKREKYDILRTSYYVLEKEFRIIIEKCMD